MVPAARSARGKAGSAAAVGRGGGPAETPGRLHATALRNGALHRVLRVSPLHCTLPGRRSSDGESAGRQYNALSRSFFCTFLASFAAASPLLVS